MSFRGKLRVFFTVIVIVPMIALAAVLLTLAADSETGKADAGIAAGVRTALAVYEDASERARAALQRGARDAALGAAAAAGDRQGIAAAVRRVARKDPGIARVAVGDQAGREIAAAGEGIAPAALRLTGSGGKAIGTLAVSVTTPEEYVREIRKLTGLDAAVLLGSSPLASTVKGLRDAPPRGSQEFELDGRDYRVRRQEIPQAVGPPTALVVFDDASDLNSSIAESRVLIIAVLLAFLLLALGTSVFVSRALQGQIGEFLEAARRLAKGDFAEPVPTHGNDEFSALGHEFNAMSGQLAAYIGEVETKRRELENTIRRVGEGFASSLDRQGVVELMVRTAVDACQAEAGRALPLDPNLLETIHIGREDAELMTGLEAAERAAFEVRPGAGRELLEPDEPQTPHDPFEATTDGVHAMAVPMRARLGARSYAQHVGVVSIARRGADFTRQEKELLDYLSGQAVVSIENTDLHETVKQQAITDELTGLANVRSLHSALEREIERGRRFDSPLGLVMVDLDDFKQINDDFGHQQGDEVLSAVAGVLRDHSRDIDLPARYGGEELAVILPQTDAAGTAQVAERMREAIEALRVPKLSGGAPLKVTASFGVAEIPADAYDKESLIAAADAALYRAKRNGKNRVERADPAAVAQS